MVRNSKDRCFGISERALCLVRRTISKLCRSFEVSMVYCGGLSSGGIPLAVTTVVSFFVVFVKSYESFRKRLSILQLKKSSYGNRNLARRIVNSKSKILYEITNNRWFPTYFSVVLCLVFTNSFSYCSVLGLRYDDS